MQAPVKHTILHLKNKIGDKILRINVLKSRLFRRDKGLAVIKAANEDLYNCVKPQPIKHHHYPAQMVALAVFMVVFANCSLRGTAKTLGFFAQLMKWDFKAPSPSSISNWVKRCGLHELLNKKGLAGDYVVIGDESIQMGKEKLFLLLGYPTDLDETQCAPLRHEDVVVLGMSVRQSWKGVSIKEFVQGILSQQKGMRIVRAVSDRGHNLLKAWRELEIPHIGDCTHWMMNGVKDIFEEDKELQSLFTSMSKLRRELFMTNLAFMLPPAVRSKDKFCQLFIVTKWLDAINAYRYYEIEGVKDKTAFLDRTNYLQLRLQQVRSLVEITGKILRRCGLSQSAFKLWLQRVRDYCQTQPLLTESATSFIAHMKVYFTNHRQFLEKGQRVLCCSEVIESIFGRYKNKGGMNVLSADILAINLYGKKITPDGVKKALERTSMKDVEKWQSENVHENRYGIIKRIKKQQILTYGRGNAK